MRKMMREKGIEVKKRGGEGGGGIAGKGGEKQLKL